MSSRVHMPNANAIAAIAATPNRTTTDPQGRYARMAAEYMQCRVEMAIASQLKGLQSESLGQAHVLGERALQDLVFEGERIKAALNAEREAKARAECIAEELIIEVEKQIARNDFLRNRLQAVERAHRELESESSKLAQAVAREKRARVLLRTTLEDAVRNHKISPMSCTKPRMHPLSAPPSSTEEALAKALASPAAASTESPIDFGPEIATPRNMELEIPATDDHLSNHRQMSPLRSGNLDRNNRGVIIGRYSFGGEYIEQQSMPPSPCPPSDLLSAPYTAGGLRDHCASDPGFARAKPPTGVLGIPPAKTTAKHRKTLSKRFVSAMRRLTGKTRPKNIHMSSEDV